MFSQSSKALKFVQKENFLGNAFMVMQHIVVISSCLFLLIFQHWQMSDEVVYLLL